MKHCSTGEPLAGQALSALLRDLVAGDVALCDMLDEARRRRLPSAVRLPSPLSPAAYSREALERLPERTSAPTWGVGIIDPWRTWIARNIERRIAEILTQTFDQLRDGRLQAVGFVPATGARMCVAGEFWGSEAVTFDTRTSGLLAGATPLFIGIEVQAATQTRTASRSAIGQFVANFDAAMQAADRRFTVDEIIAAARAALGNVSGPEVEAALRRSPVSARAGAGRRAAHEVPTEAELAAAASRAVEASSNPA